MLTFNAQFETYIRQIEAAIPNLLSPVHLPLSTVHVVTADYQRLKAAMQYSLEAGGKRLRPVLVLATYEALSRTAHATSTESPQLIYALALECIHTYSLIHDDLPCMDDDDLRRGRPSNHRAFDEATAVLAGDALLNEAFTLLFKAAQTNPLLVRAGYVLAACAGKDGMIGGQMMDMQAVSSTDSVRYFDQLQLLKTAGLIRAAILGGAILADVPETLLADCDQLAIDLGLAFQIQDDVLDVTASADEMGKTTGKDARQNKLSAVALFGLDEAKKRAKHHFDQCFKLFDQFETQGYDIVFLRELVHWIQARKQ